MLQTGLSMKNFDTHSACNLVFLSINLMKLKNFKRILSILDAFKVGVQAINRHGIYTGLLYKAENS